MSPSPSSTPTTGLQALFMAPAIPTVFFSRDGQAEESGSLPSGAGEENAALIKNLFTRFEAQAKEQQSRHEAALERQQNHFQQLLKTQQTEFHAKLKYVLKDRLDQTNADTEKMIQYLTGVDEKLATISTNYETLRKDLIAERSQTAAISSLEPPPHATPPTEKPNATFDFGTIIENENRLSKNAQSENKVNIRNKSNSASRMLPSQAAFRIDTNILPGLPYPIAVAASIKTSAPRKQTLQSLVSGAQPRDPRSDSSPESILSHSPRPEAPASTADVPDLRMSHGGKSSDYVNNDQLSMRSGSSQEVAAVNPSKRPLPLPDNPELKNKRSKSIPHQPDNQTKAIPEISLSPAKVSGARTPTDGLRPEPSISYPRVDTLQRLRRPSFFFG